MDKYTVAEVAYKNGYNQAQIDRVGKGWLIMKPDICCKNCGSVFELTELNTLDNFKYCPFCGKAQM